MGLPVCFGLTKKGVYFSYPLFSLFFLILRFAIFPNFETRPAVPGFAVTVKGF